MHLQLPDAAATEALGAALADAIRGQGGVRVYLYGELGSGKTTLVRGLLRGAGHHGTVRSPTYTLIEPYSIPGGELFHLDLYRLGAAEELEYLGLRDLEQPDAVLLVEWPQRGEGVLPPADVEIRLEYAGDQRRAGLQAHSGRGDDLLQRLRLPAEVVRA